MAALTKSGPRGERGQSPGTNFTYWPALPVKADMTIYVGAMVGMLSGYLRPVTRNASMVVLGVYTGNPAYPGGNMANPESETFSTVGLADGARSLSFVKRGIFIFNIDADDPVTKADIGKVVYALDDNTIAKTNGLSDDLSPKAGRLYDVIGGKAHVLLGEVIP